MAIKNTVTTSHGIEVVDAYQRVECVEIVGKTQICYRVRSYKDNTGLPFFEEKFMTSEYDINGSNPIGQAYSHLKTLPDFSGAVDC